MRHIISIAVDSALVRCVATVAAVLTIAAAANGQESASDGVPLARKDPVVAEIGGRTIRLSDVDNAASGKLLSLRIQENTLRKQQLQVLIDAALVEDEAAKRGLTVQALTKAEIDDKVPALSDEEAKLILESSQVQSVDDKAVAAVQQRTRQQRLARRRADFFAALRAKANPRILLDPVRLVVESDRITSRAAGPADAAVRIVEFSDFQCPYCAKMAPVLNELRKRHPDTVRIEFRDLPIEGHAYAQRAAEASRCAAAQGKFWELHDSLFRNQAQLNDTTLLRLAGETGIDIDRMNACLEAGTERAAVTRDRDTAQRFGVNGTPAFFVNGRPLFGAVSIDALETLIKEETNRKQNVTNPDEQR